MSEQPQGNRVGQQVTNLTAADISRNPNRLVIGLEDGNINISYVRNHETTVTVRVSGNQISLALPPINATVRNSGNANSQQQASISAVPVQINQNIPSNLTLPADIESYVRCPVCFCPINDNQPRATTCGHVYCGPCLERCLRMRAKCPICGTPQEYRHCLPLFL